MSKGPQMLQSCKVFGLGMVVALAMSILAAPAAHAELFITGEQITHGGSSQHTLTLSGGQKISCSTPTLRGTIDEKRETVTMTPTYSGCIATIGSEKHPTTMTMNGCDYLFKAGAEDKEAHFAGGTMSLVCPESKKTELDVYKSVEGGESLCTIKVLPFESKTEATFTNTLSSPGDVDLTTSVSGISVERTGSLLCGNASTIATYTGATTLKAYDDKEHAHQVWLEIDEKPLTTPELTGEQITHGGSSQHTLTLSGGQKISCSTPTLRGTIDEKRETVTMTPTYSGCIATIGSEKHPTTMTMNGCDYLFKAGAEDKEAHFAGGTMSLVCPESKKTELDVYKSVEGGESLCTIKVLPFESKTEATFTNTLSSPGDVDLTTSVSGISVERTGSLLCGNASTIATYTGATTLKAYDDKEHAHQVWLEIE